MGIDLAGNFTLTPEDYQRIYVQQCLKEGLIPAIQHPVTGEFFTGNSHHQAYCKRREIRKDEGRTLKESRENGAKVQYKSGFLNREGEFLTRAEVERQYGFRISETLTEL